MNLDYLSSLVIPNAGAEFRGDDVRRFLGPCVYIALRGNGVLYIGSSAIGFSRVFDAEHHNKSFQAECDRLLVYPCRSEKAARELEGVLIRTLKTKYNRHRGTKKHLADRLGVKPVAVIRYGEAASILDDTMETLKSVQSRKTA